MSKSSGLRVQDVRAVYELANECRDLGDNPHGWRRHWLAGMARLIGADLAFGGELAGLRTGIPRDLGAVDWGVDRGFDRAGWLRALELLKDDPTYSTCLVNYSQQMRRGDGSSLRRSDLVGDRVWERTIECQLVFRTLGIDHTIYCFRAIPTAPDEVSGSMLSRAAGRRDFKVREKEIAREAHTVLGPLVGGPLARFAEPSPTGLPPRVGQVLRCLLEGDSDKQAAARLGISAHTVNEYVKTIFKHFGVQSRAELMARWVRRGWGSRFARWPEADPPRGG